MAPHPWAPFMSHFLCDTFPLIFNGSEIMSAVPPDMEHDMAGRESETDVEALIDELIERVGSEEAIRRIKAKVKGTAGRPVGLAYPVDYELLLLAGALRIE